MKCNNAMPRLGVVALLAFAGSGCGDGLTKGKVEEALQRSFGDHDACWTPDDLSTARFPLQADFDSSLRNGNAIIDALANSGLIRLAIRHASSQRSGDFGRQVMLIDLTDAGRKAEVWDPARGFCIGTKKVADVLHWTAPAHAAGGRPVKVTYTWRIDDVPGWATGPAFTRLQGVDEPVQANALLAQRKGRWAVVQ